MPDPYWNSVIDPHKRAVITKHTPWCHATPQVCQEEYLSELQRSSRVSAAWLDDFDSSPARLWDAVSAGYQVSQCWKQLLLVIVPWMVILLAEGAGNSVHTIPMSAMGQAGQYVFLLVSGGQRFLGLVLPIPSIVGQYTAPVVSFGLFVFIAFVFGISAFRSYS